MPEMSSACMTSIPLNVCECWTVCTQTSLAEVCESVTKYNLLICVHVAISKTLKLMSLSWKHILEKVENSIPTFFLTITTQTADWVGVLVIQFTLKLRGFTPLQP